MLTLPYSFSESFPKTQARLQKSIDDSGARDFSTGERSGLQEYFVYFKITSCTDVGKDPAWGGKTFQKCAKNKKGRGETSPRT